MTDTFAGAEFMNPVDISVNSLSQSVHCGATNLVGTFVVRGQKVGAVTLNPSDTTAVFP